MLRRRVHSSVVAKVTQKESKTSSKGEDQPSPDDNLYVVVMRCADPDRSISARKCNRMMPGGYGLYLCT